MSLINQILKELDQSKANTASRFDILGDLTPPVFNRTLSLKWPVIIFASTAVLISGMVITRKHHHLPPILSMENNTISAPPQFIDNDNNETQAVADIESITINQDSDNIILSSQFTNPIWYSLETNDKLLLTINNVALTKYCEKYATEEACLQTFSNPNISDVNVSARAVNDKQIELNLNLADGIKLTKINYDEKTYQLNVFFTPDSQSALLKQPSKRQQNLANIHQLIDQHKYTQALYTLNKLVEKFPKDEEIKLTIANIYVRQNQLTRALDYLQKDPPAMLQHLNYYNMMASLFLQTKDYVNAKNLYQQLLLNDSTQGKWWLGLGIACEALDERNDAYTAFKNATQSATLSSNLQSYAHNRLALLGE